MMLAHMAVGSIAEMVAAVAAIVSAGLSIFALKTALQANRTADAIRAQSAEDAQRQLKLAQEKDRREIASSFTTCWSVRKADDQWGVMLLNEGPAAATVRDVIVRVRANATPDELEFDTVPTGKTFKVSSRVGPRFAETVCDPSGYSLVTQSPRHSVDAIEFSDALGKRWKWDSASGLTARGGGTAT